MPEDCFNLLFTAEHASNAIPARYRDVERCAGAVLQTHRGYDPGTAELARRLARSFNAPLLMGRYSRLLIELNRSLHHPRLWSEFSTPLDAASKKQLVTDYYHSYRGSVADQIRKLSRAGRPVLHISVHSFTPKLGGKIRNADIGLLYDPSRKTEATFCARWTDSIKSQTTSLRVRRNYPYLGIADGLVPYLRRQFSAEVYAGVELEVNQSFPLGPVSRWNRTMKDLFLSLTEASTKFCESGA